jgi:circadian clock protein KaiB
VHVLTATREAEVETEEVFYELTLYVSGASALAARAIANARRLCEAYCNGSYHLSVVDIHEDQRGLLAHDLLATPTLVKSLPEPVRRVVGDLSHTENVAMTLDLPGATDGCESASGQA